MVDRHDQNKLHTCIHISKNKQYSLKVLSLVMNTLRACVYTQTHRRAHTHRESERDGGVPFQNKQFKHVHHTDYHITEVFVVVIKPLISHHLPCWCLKII